MRILHFSLFERSLATEKMLDLCNQNNIRIIAWKPVERGTLGDGVTHETILAIAEKYGSPASHIALNWLISQDCVLAIPKASQKNHIDENCVAVEFELSSQNRLVLNTLSS